MSDKENKTTDATPAEPATTVTDSAPQLELEKKPAQESSHKTDDSGKKAEATTGDQTGDKTGQSAETKAAPKPVDKPTAPTDTGTSAGKKHAPILALSALIIALGAAAASGYTFWQQQIKTTQSLQQLAERNSQLESQLQRQAQALNNLQTLPAATNKLSQSTQNLQQQQADQRQQLLDLASAFAKTQGPKPADWLQAEAEYLLRLANHRLQLEGDVKGAKTLLISADERLQKADNPALFVVRETIANELASLNSVNTLDQSGIYFKLNALEGQIDQLPLPLEPESRSAFQQGTAASGQDQSVWQTLWDEAKTLVVVRHREEKITPLLPPQESLYLRHNLRLTLQQAQIALLKEEQQLFQSLMEQAAGWVKTHFDQNQSRTKGMLASLNELARQEIRQQRPNIAGSLSLLRNLQKQRFSSQPANPAPTVTPATPAENQEAPAS